MNAGADTTAAEVLERFKTGRVRTVTWKDPTPPLLGRRERP